MSTGESEAPEATPDAYAHFTGLQPLKTFRATLPLQDPAECARLAFEHHRNAVADRKRQPVGIADELLAIVLGRSPMLQRPLAERADQEIKQAGFHSDRPVREEAATPAAPGRR